MKDIIEIGDETIIWLGALRERLGTGPHTIQRWVARGLLAPPIMLGNRQYFRLKEFEEFLLKGE